MVDAGLKTLIETAVHGEDAGIRREALIALGYQKDPSIFNVLIGTLSDPNASLQHAAVISLGRYGDPRAIEELIKPKVLHSSVDQIRWAAVSSLGKLGDVHVIDDLLKAAEDPEWIVRNQAATELKGKIQHIIDSGEEHFARILIRLLALDNREIVDLTIEGLQRLGNMSVPMLINALQSPSSRVRQNSACVLGKLRSDNAMEPLISLLKDPEWEVRYHALLALGEIRDERSVDPVVRMLQDHVTQVQQAAMQVLIRYRSLSTASLLKSLGYEKDKFTLRAILLTLGGIADEKSVPALISHLSSSYFVVRGAAADALIQFGPKIADRLIPGLSFNRSDIKALLKEASDTENPVMQLRAVRALGGLEEHRALGLLKKLVEEGNPDIQDAASRSLIQISGAAWGRCMAVHVLGEIGNITHVPMLIQSLEDDSIDVRFEAVKALTKVGGDEAIAALIDVLKDQESCIRFQSIRMLRRIGVGHPRVLESALKALKDPHRDVRAQAARLLGNFHDPRSIQPLLRRTADPHWSVRESAENALLNFGSNAVPQLIGALDSPSWTTRFRAVRILGEVGDERTVAPLEKLLRKKGERKAVRQVVRDSLEKLKNKSAAE